MDEAASTPLEYVWAPKGAIGTRRDPRSTGYSSAVPELPFPRQFGWIDRSSGHQRFMEMKGLEIKMIDSLGFSPIEWVSNFPSSAMIFAASDVVENSNGREKYQSIVRTVELVSVERRSATLTVRFLGTKWIFGISRFTDVTRVRRR